MLNLRARAKTLAPDATVSTARLFRDPIWWVLVGAWLLVSLGLFQTATKYASTMAAVEDSLHPSLYFNLQAVQQAEFIGIVSLAAYRYRALGGVLLLIFTTGASLSYLLAPALTGHPLSAFLVQERLIAMGVVLVVGALVTFLAEVRARDREKRERALAEAAAGHERLAALYEAGQALAQAGSLSEAPAAAAKAVTHHMGPGSAAAVYLYSPDANVFLLGARDGLSAEAVRSLNVLPGSKVQEAVGAFVPRPISLTALPADLACLGQGLGEQGFVSCMFVPLRFQQEWLGLMVVAIRSSFVDSEEVDVLDGVGRQAALAIRNAQLYESERHQRAVAEGLVRSLRSQLGTNPLHVPTGGST